MYNIIAPYVRNPPLALAAARLWALGFDSTHSPLQLSGHSRCLMGMNIQNPIGLAAGIDRTGFLLNGTVRAGYGFTEVGSVTTRTLGVAVGNLSRARRQQSDLVTGVNIRSAPDNTGDASIANYLTCLHKLLPLADYAVLNLNAFISPNHPGTNAAWLERLLSAALNERDLQWQMCGKRIPLALKFPISDELSDIQLYLLQLCRQVDLDGVVVVSSAALDEARVCELLRTVKTLVGDVDVVSVGGIDRADQVASRIAAGAAAVQLFSCVLKHGPQVPQRLLKGLSVSTAMGVSA